MQMVYPKKCQHIECWKSVVGSVGVCKR